MHVRERIFNVKVKVSICAKFVVGHLSMKREKENERVEPSHWDQLKNQDQAGI